MQENLVVRARAYKIQEPKSNIVARATVNLGTKDGSMIAINDVRVRQIEKEDEKGEKKTFTFVDLPEKLITNEAGEPVKDEQGHNVYSEYVSFNVDADKHPEQAKKISNLISNTVQNALKSYDEEKGYGEAEKETDFKIDKDRVTAYSKSQDAPSSIYFGNIMRIDNVWLNKSQDGKEFISLPERSYEKDGEKKYVSIVAPVEKGLRDKMLQAVKDAKSRVVTKEETTVEKTEVTKEDEEAEM